MSTRRSRSCAAVAATFLLSSLLASEARATLLKPNILYFGNSFTMSYFPTDLPGVVDAMTDAAGRQRGTSFRRTDSGASLQNHLDATGTNAISYLATQQLPAGQTWDYVVIQGQSLEATAAMGDPTLFRNDAKAIFNGIAASNPTVKAVMYETWARAPFATGFYPTPYASPAAMQTEIGSNYRAVANGLNATKPNTARYAAVGDAFARLGFPATLYDSEGYHSNNRGELMIALTIFGSLYGPTTSRLANAGAFDAVATSLYLTHADVVAAAIAADAVGAPRGDADLDSDVDFDDLLTLAQHYGASTGQQWTTGDFNGDGAVNFDDLLPLAQNYGHPAPANVTANADFTADWALAQSLVPEPSTLVVAMAAVLASRRRR